jgi:uncharacterized protein HemX
MSDQEKDQIIKELLDRAGGKKGIFGNVPEWVKIAVILSGAAISAYYGTQQGLAQLNTQIATLQASFIEYRTHDAEDAKMREARIGKAEDHISNLNGRVSVNEEQIREIQKKTEKYGR